MSANLASPPLQTDLINGPKDLTMTKVWYQWFAAWVNQSQTTAFAVVPTLALVAQAASIGLTSIVPLAAEGLYRVCWHLRVTQAASTSSSLQVALTTTEGGITCVQSGTAVTGNTTATVQSGTLIVRPDASTPIAFSTTYGSVGATPMQYRLDLRVESL